MIQCRFFLCFYFVHHGFAASIKGTRGAVHVHIAPIDSINGSQKAEVKQSLIPPVLQRVSPRNATANLSHVGPVKPASLLAGGENMTSWKSSRAWRVACDSHIKMHPDKISCPSNCPYIRAEPTRVCEFKCVPASACNSDNPLASYANPRSKRCESCKVAGCHRCGDSRKHCAECQEGFYMKNGKCFSKNWMYYSFAFVIIGCLVVFVVYYIIAVALRPVVNDVALKAGLQFRELSATRDVARDRRYSLWTDLTKKDINGGGVLLHFRWQRAVLYWAVFATVLFMIAGFLYWERLGVFHKPNSRKGYDACEKNVRLVEMELGNMEVVYFFCVLILYLVTFLGSLCFAVSQHRVYRESDLNEATIRDFALVASGFPRLPGTEKVEEDHLNFIKSSPQFEGLDVVGVSVCWDYRDKQDEVEEQVKREFDIASAEQSTDYAADLQKCESARDDESKKRSCIDPQLKCVDGLLGIGGMPCASSGDAEEPELEDIKEMIEGIESSGCCYITMGNTVDHAKALANLKKQPLVYKREDEEHEIQVDSTECEPTTVLWKGYGTVGWKFKLSILFGCFAVFVCVLILDIFFYAPYVIYILSFSDVPGMSQGGFVSGLLLGLLITICNMIIFNIIGLVADKCGWTNADSKDCFYCVKYTIVVFFNTCLDLGTVLILAQGYSVDEAMKAEVAADSTMSSKAIAESPNMQKALYVQLVAYIFPSCTLLPYLLEPLGTALLPFLMGKWLVGSRPEVTVQEAEQCLQNPPHDLSRYGDIIVNVMLCCITMVFTYCDLWKLYLYMIISLLVIYVWDQLRVLRYTTRTIFASCTMDDAAMYMMAMPCGVLLTALVFKAYGASHQGFLEDLRRQLKGDIGLAPDRYNIFMWMGGAFITHLVVHWLMIKFVVIPYAERGSEEDSQDFKYADSNAQTAANFFNTNPINCIRSKYVYKQEPPCIFFRKGKEHLIKKNEEAGIYFEGKVHVDEKETTDDGEDDDGELKEEVSQKELMKRKLEKGKKKMTTRFKKFADGV